MRCFYDRRSYPAPAELVGTRRRTLFNEGAIDALPSFSSICNLTRQVVAPVLVGALKQVRQHGPVIEPLLRHRCGVPRAYVEITRRNTVSVEFRAVAKRRRQLCNHRWMVPSYSRNRQRSP